MDYNYFKHFIFILFLTSLSANSQTILEKQKIIKEYNTSELKELQKKYSDAYYKEKNNALVVAQQKGWKVKFTENGSYYELMKVSKNGKPIYYKTDNLDAAISTRTNFMHANGGLGLNIEGQGMTAYVWDGGIARGTHQEYDGIGGNDRFTIGDNSTELNFHAAHVTGTIISSGFDISAKGMAPQANGIGHDWGNDLSEATAAAAAGMLVSNHSYGYRASDIQDWQFGAYGTEANEWDNLLYNAPYYLKVVSAGNDGSDDGSNADPLNGNSAFDKLNGDKTSKNSLIIANGQDAAINPTDGSLLSVLRNPGSSEGPTDDLRIKPDIMGNGTGLYSSGHERDDEYTTLSGTSMSAPNVTGSLILLQQYYNSLNGNFMKAATLKGLVMHTADDVDIVGPDPHVGWGLLNTKFAAETIAKSGFESWVSEESLANGATYTFTVKSDGFTPLMASISWTDKPGVVNTGTANDPSIALVNDLDIRVSKAGTTYKPWRLSGIYSNEQEDNLVDTFERVDIPNASGEYTITVTHKGTLAENQNFSLVVTGTSGEFNFIADNSKKEICPNEDAVFNFEYRQAVAGTTQLTTSTLPAGMTATFSGQSINANGNFTVTFGNLNNVTAGTYEIDVIGNNGTETQNRTVKVTVFKGDFNSHPTSTQSPTNGEKGVSFTKTNLTWQANVNANMYKVEVSDTATFNNILFTNEATSTSFEIEGLQDNKVYYWRVQPKNNCTTGNFSETSTFQTGINDCSNSYSATDFSDARGGFLGTNNTSFVPIEVTDNLLINSLTITTDINHTDVKDLTLILKEPSANGTKQATLLSRACDDTNNIANVTFDDTASNLNCNNTAPAITGATKPLQALNGFSGKMSQGTWFLEVNDFDNMGDGGQINSASITVCQSLATTNAPTFNSSIITLDANSTYTITAASMAASTATETATQQIFTLVNTPTNGQLQKNGTVLNAGDTFTQADIAANIITFVNTKTSSFADQFTVNITNAANGWLGNQVVNIEETTLGVSTFSVNSISLYPNPTRGILNVKLNNVTTENVRIIIFDLQGRKVNSSVNKPTNTNFTKEIDTKNMSTGIYILSIEQGNKKTTKKIIVTK